jgi:hypothetical protein
MYVLPVDRFSQSFRRYSSGFDDNLRKLMWGDEQKFASYSRSVYDSIFYDKLAEPLRYRIHFLVSLYYLYSRVAAAGLFYSIGSAALLVCEVVPSTSNALTNFFVETQTVLEIKFLALAILEGGIALSSWRYANKTIDSVTNLETVLSRIYASELKTKASGLG